MNRRLRFLALALAWLTMAQTTVATHAQETVVVVFAAASTANAMDALASLFESEHPGIEVRASYAASSILARQIANGAPAQIFLSANPQWMDYVVERGWILESSRTDLMANQLVLIAAPGELFGLSIGPNFPLAQALDGERLAMGDPDHVPAGTYGREALEYLEVWQQVEPLVVRAMDVRGALVLVERGEAAAGIVYASDADLVKGLAVVGTFPADSHAPIVYPVAALGDSATEATGLFLDFLKSPVAASIFANHGFSPVPGK